MTPSNTPKSRWSLLREASRRAEYSRYQRKVLAQVGTMLGHIAMVNIVDRMEFAHQFTLAVSGLNVWEDMESLVYLYCDRFPVSHINFSASLEKRYSDLVTELERCSGCIIYQSHLCRKSFRQPCIREGITTEGKK